MKKNSLLYFTVSVFFCLNVQASQFGTFMLVKGKVFIEAQSGEKTEAKVNSRIYEGQTVITEVDSRAKIVMSDRNVLNILPETRLKIEKYRTDQKNRKVSLQLIEGRVRTDVQQDYDMNDNKFEVRTNTAVAGVRGTQFLTSFESKSGKTEVTTFDGVVEVSFNADNKSNGAENRIRVNPGERIKSSADGKNSQIEKVSSDELKELDRGSNLKDDDKRSQMNQKKNDDGVIVGGINNEPLRPKDNLSVEPREDNIIAPVKEKTEVKVIIGN